MKKLMIAAAAAAMIGSAQAIVCVSEKVCEKDPCTGEKTCEEVTGAGIAHKVTISLKTTDIKGQVKKTPCDEECTYWRIQKTKKINGLLWEQLDDCSGCVAVGANSAFWTDKGALDLEFAIGVGLIGKGTNSKKIEAYGALTGDEFGALTWAGFGSMAATTKKNREDPCGEDDCTMYVNSISGGIAGQLDPADWTDDCQDCEVIAYEGCCDDLQLVKTAAYGTIKISYDKATAKKVALAEDDQDIASFYKLPKAVNAEDIVIGEIVPEE